jgi:hypothetical protein
MDGGFAYPDVYAFSGYSFSVPSVHNFDMNILSTCCCSRRANHDQEIKPPHQQKFPLQPFVRLPFLYVVAHADAKSFRAESITFPVLVRYMPDTLPMLHSPVVNLSCGNCKTIQSFSGDPPKCDVCGWVCGTESTDTAYWQNLRILRYEPVDSSKGTSSNQQRQPAISSKTPSGDKDTAGCLAAVLWVLFALGFLWVLIAIVKFMWVHS